MDTSVHDFLAEPDAVDLGPAVNDISAAQEHLTVEQADQLRALLDLKFPTEIGYGAEFDFKAEIDSQIRAVKAMRNSVLTESGAIKAGMGARDIKEVVTASNTLLQTLLKTHDKIINYERMRAVEKATIEVVQTLEDSAQATFFTRLEEELDKIA